MEEHVPTLPVGWQVERTSVRACIVVKLADVRRVRVKLCGPCIANILICGISKAVELEESRHRKIGP